MKLIKKVTDFVKRAPAVGPRVLLTDIETFPIEAYVWGLFKQNIGLDFIKDDFKLMSFCGKWLEDPAVYYIDNRNSVNPRNDAATVAAAHFVLSNTDVVIAHNGQKFDLRKIRARCAILKHPPLHQLGIIDTLLENRKAFGFDSQKLAYVTSVIGAHEKDEHGEFPGMKLWVECMAGNLRAWEANRKYNVMDVVSMESLYLELRGWYTGTANLAVYFEKLPAGTHVCPNCASSDVKMKGKRRTQVGVYQRYQCNNCGGWSRGRTLLLSKAERAHILMN